MVSTAVSCVKWRDAYHYEKINIGNRSWTFETRSEAQALTHAVFRLTTPAGAFHEKLFAGGNRDMAGLSCDSAGAIR
ncbi:MAG: hypothetical protein ACLSIL_10245 [Enterococcus casseliflavus]